MTEEDKREGNIQKALKHLKIADQDTEVYPEFYKAEKQYQKDFGSNTTFVTFTHLLRSMLGPTILAIPSGFKFGGLGFSAPGFLVILVLVTYNMRRLILNASHLSEREQVSVRTYDEVAYVAFNTCNDRTKTYANAFKQIINLMFIITYLDACVIFMIFISRNVEALMLFYYPDSFLEVRYFIFFQVIILMGMSCFRELKKLSPFSLMAAILLVTALICIVWFYFLKNLSSISSREIVGSPMGIVHFTCIVLFCLSGISIALTLKSSMKTPEKFFSFPWIFYISVGFVGVLFIIFGFLGYQKYGSETQPSILLNIPPDGKMAVCVKIITIISVLFTSPLVFYVSFNVLWNNFLKQLFSPINVLYSEYFIRFCLIVTSFIFAMAFPELGKMIVLKGALFHSHLEVTIPAILDYVTYYPEKGSGKYHCRLFKTVVITLLGIVFCVAGTAISIVNWENLS